MTRGAGDRGRDHRKVDGLRPVSRRAGRRFWMAGGLAAALALGYWTGAARQADAQSQMKPTSVTLLSRGGARMVTGTTDMQSLTAPTGRASGSVTFGLSKPFLSPPRVILTAVEGGDRQAVVPLVESVTPTGFTYTAHAPYLRGPQIRFRLNWLAVGEVPAEPAADGQ